MGSGSIISQLALENLIDEYEMVVNPIVLAAGRTMFDSIKDRLNLKLTKSRTLVMAVYCCAMRRSISSLEGVGDGGDHRGFMGRCQPLDGGVTQQIPRI